MLRVIRMAFQYRDQIARSGARVTGNLGERGPPGARTGASTPETVCAARSSPRLTLTAHRYYLFCCAADVRRCQCRAESASSSCDGACRRHGSQSRAPLAWRHQPTRPQLPASGQAARPSRVPRLRRWLLARRGYRLSCLGHSRWCRRGSRGGYRSTPTALLGLGRR